MAEEQAALFGNLDATFTALAGIARPFLQDTSPSSRPRSTRPSASSRSSAPSSRTARRFSASCAPGVRVLPATLPDLADALEFGSAHAAADARPQPPRCQRVRLAGRVRRGPAWCRAASAAAATRRPRSSPRIAFLTPAQTTCNYITLWFRNIASLLSEGDADGTWQRFIIVATPRARTTRAHPRARPPTAPTSRTTCTPTRTRTRRRRARTRSARPATRTTAGPPADRQRAGQPGHQDAGQTGGDPVEE